MKIPLLFICFAPCPEGRGGGRGALGYFLGEYVPPGTPNWHPVLMIPRSRNGPVFLYPVLEFALKLIPRSRDGPIFYTPL